jgi:hypothetical protein
MTARTYEAILSEISELRRSASVNQREVVWLTTADVVGVSRTTGGGVEIFLSGSELTPKSRVVKRALEYQTWHRAGGLPSVNANRILLPAVGHFDQVAAFLCAELIRSGSDADLATAFSKTEMIIELSIMKLRMTDRAVLGLTGELLLLDSMLRQASNELVGQIAESWHGWRESTRDLSWSTIGVEVKTTTLSTSTHHVQGVHQVERVEQPDTVELEQKLFLVSIGLEWLQPDQNYDNAHTLPELVESILERLLSERQIEMLLNHIQEYGDNEGFGYDHRTMSLNRSFTRPFVARFVRCYDMSDPLIKVLRSTDLRLHEHVDVASVKFRVELPQKVEGDLNPVVGLNQAASTILAAGQL